MLRVLCQVLIYLLLFGSLSACGLKSTVGTSTSFDKSSNLGLAIIGVSDTTSDMGDWEIHFFPPGVNYHDKWHDAHEELRVVSMAMLGGTRIGGTTYYLRTIKPGHYETSRIGGFRQHLSKEVPEDQRDSFLAAILIGTTGPATYEERAIGYKLGFDIKAGEVLYLGNLELSKGRAYSDVLLQDITVNETAVQQLLKLYPNIKTSFRTQLLKQETSN